MTRSLIRFSTRLAADVGGSGGGGEDKRTEPDGTRQEDELEELRKKLAEETSKREAAERKAEEAEKAKLTEDERKAVEDKAAREAVALKLRQLSAKSIGLEEKYLGLVAGRTSEEIETSAKLLEELLADRKAAVEADLKKQAAQTGSPGGDAGKPAALTPEEFYRSLINAQAGGK